MKIDVVFDTVCPWCFIGKRRLSRALSLRPGTHAELRWRPFLLNPDMPDEGMDYAFYLERKFGSSYRVQRIQAAAQLAGEPDGIAFAFDRIAHMPSSMQSHRLIAWAAAQCPPDQDCASLLVESIYRAFFEQGEDIGDIAVLRRLAEAAGLSGRAAAAYLAGDAGFSAVESDNSRLHRLGVSGVPCFILNGTYAVSGAQEPDMLARMIDIARESDPGGVSAG